MSGQPKPAAESLKVILKESVYDNDVISAASMHALRTIEYARNGSWPDIRIYDPLWIPGGLNIFGVDKPFSSALPGGAALLRALDIEKIIRLANEEFKETSFNAISLARLHCNGNSSYRGAWHRDGLCSENDADDVIAVIYLEAEEGFRIVEGCNDFKLKNYECPTLDMDRQPGEEASAARIEDIALKCTAHPGDVLFFNSGLLHKGEVDGRRLHLHLRITSTEKWSEHNRCISFRSYEGYYLNELLHPDHSLTEEEDPEISKRARLRLKSSNLVRVASYVNPLPCREWVRGLLTGGARRTKYNPKGNIYKYLKAMLKRGYYVVK